MIHTHDVGSNIAIPQPAILDALIIGASTTAITVDNAPNIAPPASCNINSELFDLTLSISPGLASDML